MYSGWYFGSSSTYNCWQFWHKRTNAMFWWHHHYLLQAMQTYCPRLSSKIDTELLCVSGIDYLFITECWAMQSYWVVPSVILIHILECDFLLPRPYLFSVAVFCVYQVLLLVGWHSICLVCKATVCMCVCVYTYTLTHTGKI